MAQLLLWNLLIGINCLVVVSDGICPPGQFLAPDGQCSGQCYGLEDTGQSYRLGRDANGHPVCLLQCGLGEFADLSTGKCQLCPNGTVMNVASHVSTQCQSCDKPVSDTEVILRPCTRGRQTIIGCVAGYYRKQTENFVNGRDTCVRCTECWHEGGNQLYTGRPCDHFQDTVCCPQLDMVVLDTPHGPKCIPSPANQATGHGGQMPVTCGVDQQCLQTDQKSGHDQHCQITQEITNMSWTDILAVSIANFILMFLRNGDCCYEMYETDKDCQQEWSG